MSTSHFNGNCHWSSVLRLWIQSQRTCQEVDLGIISRKLWDEVVSPVVDLLQTIHPFRSRIWYRGVPLPCSPLFPCTPLVRIGQANEISPISTSRLTPPRPLPNLNGRVSHSIQVVAAGFLAQYHAVDGKHVIIGYIRIVRVLLREISSQCHL